jgi:hypothetical protein
VRAAPDPSPAPRVAPTPAPRAAIVLLALAACRITEPFPCALDEHCGPGGRCEPAGYCSFPDPACADGRRYDELAGGGVAGQCVASPTCPASYTATIPGTGSRYRVVTQPASWPDAQADCADDGAGTHLVVIGSDAERTGVGALAGDDLWIGLSDRAVEGSFRWVTGAATPFTAWAAGQPNDADGTEDCVEQKRMMDAWHDQPCTELLAYVCECDGVAPVPGAP